MLTEISKQDSELGIYIAETHVGLGLFSTQPFHDGHIVGSVDGVFLPDSSQYGSDYCIGLDATTSLEPAPPFSYVNHSCDPNCAIFYDCREDENGNTAEHDVWIETLRPIEPGEELTIDYNWPADAAIPCQCGSENCRGWICCEEELDQLTRPHPSPNGNLG